MDVKNKKILAELLIDSRISLPQLAKKVAISRELLQYRLKKLEKEFIIKYSSQINIQSLGFQRTGCYVSLQKNTLEFEKKFISFLKKNNFVSGISANIGKYDLIFDIFYKNNEDLRNTVYEVEVFLKDKLKEIFFVGIPVDQKFFHNKIITQRNTVKQMKKITEIKIDEIDRLILHELNNNARESLVNISKKCKRNANSIGYRIKNLEKSNIITHSTIFLNFDKLGFELYNIQIKTMQSAQHEKILKFLEEQLNTFYYYHYHGNKDWDIDIGIAIKNKLELKKIFQQLKQFFGEIIEFKEIYMIENIYKEELPKGVFQ